MWILDIMGVILAIAGVCFVLAMAHDLWAAVTGNEKRLIRPLTRKEEKEWEEWWDEGEEDNPLLSPIYSYLPENIYYDDD